MQLALTPQQSKILKLNSFAYFPPFIEDTCFVGFWTQDAFPSLFFNNLEEILDQNAGIVAFCENYMVRRVPISVISECIDPVLFAYFRLKE